MKREFSELELVRRKKLDEYAALGIAPFAREFAKPEAIAAVNKKWAIFSREELTKKVEKIVVSGRVMAMRDPFMVLKDSSGSQQVYLPTKELDERSKNVIRLLDLGDIVEVIASPMKTQTNEFTLRAKQVNLITKSLRPLPEKWHGLKDVEERYRRRYVDLIVNDDVRKTFWTRTHIISYIRDYFNSHGYMEADTPILQSILGGAAAKPFTTHHNALDQEFYLRIATELPLKRLLVGGIDRVYEIGRLFRNEGIDTTHNPEFTSIEFYEAYSNLEGMIQRTEEVFAFIAKKLGLSELKYQDKTISLKAPFARVNMVDAVSKATKVDFKKATMEVAKATAKKYKIKVEKYFTIGHIINELFEALIEETLVQPTFVYGHPVEISPLAAINVQDPRFTDRAELFIDGREYANMFTELNDPIDQLGRFEAQLNERNSGNEEANEIDYDFVEALEHAMPPAGGCGIGIDRLVMLFTNSHSIRDVLLFPHLREKVKK